MEAASWLSAVALGQGSVLPAGSSTGAVSLVWVFQWELVNISNDEMLGGLSCSLVFSLQELQCSWCYIKNFLIDVLSHGFWKKLKQKKIALKSRMKII